MGSLRSTLDEEMYRIGEEPREAASIGGTSSEVDRAGSIREGRRNLPDAISAMSSMVEAAG